jgi:hypothetical protein
VNLVLPFTGPAGSCAVPPASAQPGLLAFGWLVRALAITLLVVYVAGLTGLARRRPGPAERARPG